MSIERKGDGLPVEKPTLENGPGLDAMAGVVAGIDAEAAAALNPGMSAGAPGAQADMGPDYMRGASGIVDLVSAMLDGYAPGAGWNDQQRTLMSASIAPVLEKYGWNVEDKLPCELVALAVCGPALYQSAKVVAFKLQQDRLALARAARGMADPNTIKGAEAAESGPQAGSKGEGDANAGAALAEAVRAAKVFPDM
ncbi:hypothetical protein [Paraburkholderia kururiensis]|uniref:hypothetical protein n=1 Tax=Paraburkholderia kururiensis TaxID=984307 RepID=UPI0005A73525|nr:hypothetical protein [Paraburkholderia kururiensis]